MIIAQSLGAQSKGNTNLYTVMSRNECWYKLTLLIGIFSNKKGKFCFVVYFAYWQAEGESKQKKNFSEAII